jgi:hypothetical protein
VSNRSRYSKSSLLRTVEPFSSKPAHAPIRICAGAFHLLYLGDRHGGSSVHGRRQLHVRSRNEQRTKRRCTTGFFAKRVSNIQRALLRGSSSLVAREERSQADLSGLVELAAGA